MTTRSRRLVVATVVLVVIAFAATLYTLPELVRHVAVARLETLTHRPVRIERVALNVWTGHVDVRGLHIGDPASGDTLASFDRLDVRVKMLPLLRGALWIRDARLERPLLRIVRSTAGINISDLFHGSGAAMTPIDIMVEMVERFSLRDGRMVFEDRALPEPRTWTSENIEVRARDLSTHNNDGLIEATSVTAGALSSVRLERVRLSPVQFRAQATAVGVDLSMARLYFPPEAPVRVDGGRASSTLTLDFDARAGIRADASAGLQDLVVVNPRSGERVLLVPRMSLTVDHLAFKDDRLEVGQLELAGAASVLDPAARGGPRFAHSTVSARIADLTWPVTMPGRLDVRATVPGGGIVTLAGALRPPPASSQLRLRLVRVNLAPWARFLPTRARIAGTAESTLDIDEPLAAAVPARVRGSVAVRDVAVRDGSHELAGARRIEASGLVVRWPARLGVARLLLDGPRIAVERDEAGDVALRRIFTPPTSGSAKPGRSPDASATAASPRVTVGEIVVRGGTLSWRDATVSAPVALQLSRIEARATGAAWPLAGHVDLIAGCDSPGGGHLAVKGRVDPSSLAGELHVEGADVELLPYARYVSTPARVTGRADFDLAVRLPAVAGEAPTARGTAALARLDVRDGQRTVLRLERAEARAVRVVWPARVTVEKLWLDRPWVLIERDPQTGLTLGALLPARSAQPRTPDGGTDGRSAHVTVEVARLVIDGGGARVVDRSLSPPFAVDLSHLAVDAAGLTTAGGRRAHVALSGQLGSGAILDLAGTVGPLPGPTHVEMRGTLDRFWLPRTDSYLHRYVGWEARQGWLTSHVSLRLERDALDARTDIRLSQLDLVQESHDEAQSRIGLPLGLIVSLMKDARGDINVSLPVTGRLRDPRFDFRDAIWSTVRNVAIKAITLPVAWIGRVRLTSDSRIDRIEIDPISFEPGTATPTPAGRAQLARLVRFLTELPAARVRLTPTVSERDLAALRRLALDREIEELARGPGIPIETAARRIFEQRFPQTSAPGTLEAMREALVTTEPVAPTVLDGLAKARVQAVRGVVEKAGIDPARLPDATPVAGVDASGSHVALDVAAPEPTQPPKRRWMPNFHGRPGPSSEPKTPPAATSDLRVWSGQAHAAAAGGVLGAPGPPGGSGSGASRLLPEEPGERKRRAGAPGPPVTDPAIGTPAEPGHSTSWRAT